MTAHDLRQKTLLFSPLRQSLCGIVSFGIVLRACGQILGVAAVVLTLFGLFPCFAGGHDWLDPYLTVLLGLGLVSMIVFAVMQGRALIDSFRSPSP